MNVRLGNQSDRPGLGNKVGKVLGRPVKPACEGIQSDRPGLGNRLGWPGGNEPEKISWKSKEGHRGPKLQVFFIY